MRKYTILHTIETGGPGGAETVLLNLASRLDPDRFRSIVLLPGTGWLYTRLRETGVPTFLAKSGRWYDLRLPRTIAAVARQEQVDLIHSHLPDQNFYTCLVGELSGRPVVASYHGSQHLSRGEGLKCALKLSVVRRGATAIVVVSEYLKKMLEAAGFPGEKIVRIYNGVEVDRLAARPGRFRAELGCENGTKLVGMVANVRDSKGYEYFIRAARLVADSMPQTKFVAVGELDERIGRTLLGLARELHLEDRLSFIGFRQDVPEILSGLDVFVLSSVSEGFSLATVEAMAAGKPVVVTRSGGPEEIIEDGRTGLLVPPVDAPALAARIREVLSDRTLASALGQRARAMVETKFTLQSMISEYVRVYERCLGPAQKS